MFLALFAMKQNIINVKINIKAFCVILTKLKLLCPFKGNILQTREGQRARQGKESLPTFSVELRDPSLM